MEELTLESTFKDVRIALQNALKEAEAEDYTIGYYERKVTYNINKSRPDSIEKNPFENPLENPNYAFVIKICLLTGTLFICPKGVTVSGDSMNLLL